MNTVRHLIAWRRRGAGDSILLVAREVTDRHRSVQSGLAEIRQPSLLNALDPDDFLGLDEVIADQTADDREYAVVLARLTLAAARAKGLDREIVDAALRLDGLLPGDDPSRERDRLLRDAYGVAQAAGYVRGGRIALGRLGQRALEGGDSERARLLLQQQLDLGEEAEDAIPEVEAALALGDLVRREGDRRAAQGLYRRAGRSAQRLDHHRGIAEALARQIELLPRETDLQTLAAIQRQASEAARRTADLGLQSRIVLSLAETLSRNGKADEAVAQLEHGLAIARQIGDLALEAKCLAALAEAERLRGRPRPALGHARALIDLEERLGNRPIAADWAIRAGTDLLEAGAPAEAIIAFERGLSLAAAAGDARLEQRALGGLGVAASLADRPAEAMQHLMRALEIARRTHDARAEARWLGSLGQLLWTFGQGDDAISTLNEALTVARRQDDGELQGGLLLALGEVYAARNQAPRARECFGRAYDRFRRLGRTDEQIRVLVAQADLATASHHFGGAIAFVEEALHLATKGGDQFAAARLHGKLGTLAERRHDHDLALDHLRRALALAERLDDAGLLARALQHLATSQHAAGDAAAATTYRRALEQARAMGDQPGEALMRFDLGLLLAGGGQREDGRRMLREAVTLASGLGPAGADLRQRAETALSTLPARPQPAAPAPAGPAVVADDDDPQQTDALFRETTLPPL